MKRRKQKIAAIVAAILVCIIYIVFPGLSVKANADSTITQGIEEIKEFEP